MSGQSIETLAVHAARSPDPATGAVAQPIHLTTTFQRDADLSYPRGFNYGRTDNLHRRAIEECPPGHVLVIDTGGSTEASSAGDLMAARLKKRGVSGLVTDGGFRDTPAIRRTGLPAYQQRAAPPATPIALHPVALNQPVGCAGVAVYPGDVLLGDGEGVVVIPRHLVDEIADEAVEAVEYEAFAEMQIALGRTIFEVFPATPESRQEYDVWVAAGRPQLEAGT